MLRKFLSAHKLIFVYGSSLAFLLFFMRWLELKLLVIHHSTEIYAGIIAILFTGLGIWLTLKLIKPKTVVVEKEVYVVKAHEPFSVNEAALEQLGLSKRELEVLQLMAEGLSNQEIAARLFVSLNTVKTHSSNLFEKMEVKRRTQAVEQGKRLGIIP